MWGQNSNDSAKGIVESKVEKAMVSKSDKHDRSLLSMVLSKDSLKYKANEFDKWI